MGHTKRSRSGRSRSGTAWFRLIAKQGLSPTGLAAVAHAGLTTVYAASHGRMPHPSIVADWAMHLGVEDAVVRRAIERSAESKRKAS